MLKPPVGGTSPDGAGEPAVMAARPEAPKAAMQSYSAAELEAIRNPSADVVRSMQAALNQAGFPVGRPDGQIGKNTLHGMRLYKVARRMPVTNEVTPALLSALAVSAN